MCMCMRDSHWMVLAKVRLLPRTEFMWTAARRKVGFRAWIPEITGERTDETSGIRKGQQIADRLNQVAQERVKVKAENGTSFQGPTDSLPTFVSPSPPASKQLKRILHFSWQEISKWPVLKLWESWYGLFAWPFPLRNLVYAWVL